MKRRTAVQRIGIGTMTLAALPYCQVDTIPVYSRIDLDHKSYRFLEFLTQMILPIPEGFTLPETQQDFVLTIMNDCRSQEEIDAYLFNLAALQEFIKEQYGTSIDKMSTTQQEQFFPHMQNDSTPEHIRSIISQTKQILLRQFMSSRAYMLNHLDFEFAPGYYEICAEV